LEETLELWHLVAVQPLVAGVIGVEQLDVLLVVSLLVKVVLERFIRCSFGFPLLYF
jgi:hypothetical protein